MKVDEAAASGKFITFGTGQIGRFRELGIDLQPARRRAELEICRERKQKVADPVDRERIVNRPIVVPNQGIGDGYCEIPTLLPLFFVARFFVNK
jgi:hypothetical protein